MAFTKITQADLESRGATTLPNQPTISASLLKQEFDAPAKEIVAPAFNNLIDELEAETAADSLGVSMPEGRTGDPTIQGAINSISEDLGTAEGKVTELGLYKHSHNNKSTIDKFSETSNKLYWDGRPVGGGGGTDDYADLENKPQINSVTLIGDMSAHDLGLATESALNDKVDKVPDKSLSTNDYTDEEKADVAKIDTIEVNVGILTGTVGRVQGKVTTLEGQMLGVQNDLDDKVDKVAGKGLSTNDYDSTDKGKVDSLGTASTKNTISVVTDSSDLVESGAVKDIVGWGNKNQIDSSKGTAVAPSGYFTVNSDKTITANGLLTNNNYQFDIPIDVSGDYLFSGCPTGGAASATYDIYIWDITTGARVKKWDGVTTSESDLGSGNIECQIPAGHNCVMSLRVFRNYQADNLVFKPMLCKKGTTDVTYLGYEPYHESVSDSLAEKADNSVIGTVEDGATASQAYSANDLFIRSGKIGKATTSITQGEPLTLGTNYIETTIEAILTGLLNA